MKIVPTVGDLRKTLRDEGMPPGTTGEWTYDLETEGAPGFLPDCLVVSRRLCELALEGAYDRYPEDTPIEKLPFAR